MAEVIWSKPALADLEAIADFIALENPPVAAELVRRVLAHAGQLATHPEGGPRPPELKRSRYRHVVEPPCRVFYRGDGERVFIVHVMRTERLLRRGQLSPGRKSPKEKPRP